MCILHFYKLNFKLTRFILQMLTQDLHPYKLTNTHTQKIGIFTHYLKLKSKKKLHFIRNCVHSIIILCSYF